MKKNQVFKEIEARIIEVAGRPFISLDDMDKIISDIIFTKSGLDIPTLRTLKRLCASIALTYKALKENEQLDINEGLAIVPLSKKKVKTIVKKSLKICSKDRLLEGKLDELEPYLGPEEPSLEISKEETEELIKGCIHESFEPYLKLLDAIDLVAQSIASEPESQPANKVPVKKTKGKKPVEEPEQPTFEDEEDPEIDFDALEDISQK